MNPRFRDDSSIVLGCIVKDFREISGRITYLLNDHSFGGDAPDEWVSNGDRQELEAIAAETDGLANKTSAALSRIKGCQQVNETAKSQFLTALDQYKTARAERALLSPSSVAILDAILRIREYGVAVTTLTIADDLQDQWARTTIANVITSLRKLKLIHKKGHGLYLTPRGAKIAAAP
jgi:hypothetical protein